MIQEIHIPTLIEEYRSGQRSLSDHLVQLESYFDLVEPKVAAFLEEQGRFDRLRQEARDLYVQYPHMETRPPLFGLLIAVKDIFHVDGFPTQAGSQLPAEVFTGPEADCVSRLRAAGALILGKTVTTEFAYFAPGATRNPHNLAHTPGGSSSGSAAAVAAGLVPFAFGTQTIGSICRPASFCGVVGFKPSYDRISRNGVIALAPALDHVGFFTQDVSGAHVMAGLLCQSWRRIPPPSARPTLGIPRGPYLQKASPEMLFHFESLCDRLKSAGYSVKDVDAFPNFEAIFTRHMKIVASQASQVHASWFARFGHLYHPKTAALIQHGREISPQELDEALSGREELRRELTALMDDYDVDLWVSPGAPGPAPRGLESTGDPVMNLPWTYSGLPTLCLPSGKCTAGLPLGLQVSARWFSEEQLLQWAIDLETKFPGDE